MNDLEIDLLDFEIDDLNNQSYETDTKKNISKDKTSLDFSDSLKNNSQTLNEIASSNNQIENIIFPDDNEMPQLDEDIINLELTGDENLLPNSIQPLKDADIVFNPNSIDNT